VGRLNLENGGGRLERFWPSKSIEMNEFTAVNEFAAGI
jgi:hypothetical protein